MKFLGQYHFVDNWYLLYDPHYSPYEKEFLKYFETGFGNGDDFDIDDGDGGSDER